MEAGRDHFRSRYLELREVNKDLEMRCKQIKKECRAQLRNAGLEHQESPEKSSAMDQKSASRIESLNETYLQDRFSHLTSTISQITQDIKEDIHGVSAANRTGCTLFDLDATPESPIESAKKMV